jgi:hypothetical protein
MSIGEDGKHEDTPPVFGHGISGMEQAVRIVRFRIAKSDAPERGWEALEYILETMDSLPSAGFVLAVEKERKEAERKLIYAIEELDKADKQLIRAGERIKEMEDAMRNAVEWSRVHALPGNPESIRRLDKLLKETTDES